MANYSQLKAAIADVIKTNGTQAITGQVLQDVLNSMVSVIGANYTFAGVATPSTNPGTPDQNVVYMASQAGTYTNFGGIELPAGISLLMWNGSWTAQTFFVLDDEPTAGSGNLVKSGGVAKEIKEIGTINSWNLQRDLSFCDEQGNSVMDVEGGEVKTKYFDSGKAPQTEFSPNDFDVCDENGNVIVEFSDGNIKTKNFDSSKIQNNTPSGTLIVPTASIPIYITCNDLNKSNNWGIGSRNKGLSVYLDHFFHTNKEKNVCFDDGNVYHTILQKIVGNGSNAGWNNNENKYEYTENLVVNNDTLNLKVRSILNSYTKNISPKVLQIGDSVTEGWFANYPVVTGAPVESWSWAKYYFEKDKQEYGSLFDSMFIGTRTKNIVNYNGISYTAYAYGWGGKTAKWYCNNQDSAFYTPNGFSLASYLSKYKTLADDGVTRLVVGSTAGTEVTDVNAWDLCTPNVVVIQLGMNDTLSDWKEYIPQIISSIKTEFPTMKVILSVLDACSCNYPSLYPNYHGIFFDNYNSDHTKLMEAYCYALDNWQDESNGIYVIYSGMVMPMPITCNVREAEGVFDGKLKQYIGVDSVERVPHPSRYAHQEIGYLLYSIIKWVLS